MFIASLAEKNQNKISTEARKKLIADLENAVDDVIAGLSRLKFKSDMSINNVAVESEKEDHILKIFI